MILTAWGDGVGSNWTGFGGLENVRKRFGLPDTYEVLAVIPFGYPKQHVMGIKKRRPLSDVTSGEHFGTSLV
jgi:nitroreductase